MEREIKTLKEAIVVYQDIVKEEEDYGLRFINGQLSEQVWNNAVYRVMCFPSHDINWNEIRMEKTLAKKFWQWESEQRKKKKTRKFSI